MSYFNEDQMKAIGDPHGLSDHCSPDGTPITNFEYWKNLNNPYK